jgi:4-alpha-glucanotransferase
VGAPPDPFSHLGQDWGFPPFRPGRLAETAYRPFRQVVRAALEHGGGLRVDHVMGLFRLWWVPAGLGAVNGTYVSYDHTAMLRVLVLEATRAAAMVVGEDLGTVEPEVRRALDEAGVLGSAVLWFTREEDETTPLPPGRWRERAVASVSTHDLPTAYGFLADEQVRVRAELGQLDRPVAEERARVRAERERLLAMMRTEGLGRPGAPDSELVLDMYRLLARTPSQVVLAMPADAVGDLRQPNLPGTRDEYPNWCLPLADRTGSEVPLETFLTAPATTALTNLLNDAVHTNR